MAKKMTRRQQEREILKLAAERGVESNYFFTTTFRRYQVQLGILDELEKSMKGDGMLVEKEYVKGRKNLYSNPAVAEYNRTSDAANKTVTTLMRIVKDMGADSDGDEEDPLLAALNGTETG